MSGEKEVLERVAFGSADRGRARRFLVGSCLAFLGFGLVQWSEDGSLRWLALGLMLTGLVLMLSQPKDSGVVIVPKNLRRMARRAGMPELGTTVVVYTSLVAGIASAVVGFIVFIATT